MPTRITATFTLDGKPCAHSCPRVYATTADAELSDYEAKMLGMGLLFLAGHEPGSGADIEIRAGERVVYHRHGCGDLATTRSEALESAAAAMAASPRDWSLDNRDAWAYGIIVGWSEDALAEVAAKHRWSEAEVERLRSLRAELAVSSS
jgi:hypothetical protein